MTKIIEPPKNRNPLAFDPTFRAKLDRVLKRLADEGTPFVMDEGFRTPDRQQWLHGQGRPASKPYGRAGMVVTQKDGVRNLSNHQGTGKFGTGRAADCYPLDVKTGKKIWPPPPSPHPLWERFAKIAEEEGLTAGYRWKKPHDPPHVELRSSTTR